jgi:hypothetical protein
MSENKVIKNGSKRTIGEWDEEMCTARRCLILIRQSTYSGDGQGSGEIRNFLVNIFAAKV